MNSSPTRRGADPEPDAELSPGPNTELNPAQLAAADALSAYLADGADDGYGGEPPTAAFADLGFADGLVIQLEMQRRAVAGGAVDADRLAEGRLPAGWKVGLTSDRARRSVGIDDRPFGHINRVLTSPATIDAGQIRSASIEPELCFVIGERIAGDDVDPASVPGRIAQVCAGFEINEARVAVGGNLALLVADNLTNWAIVQGPGTSAAAAGDLDDCRVTLTCDAEQRFSCTASQEVDNPYLSISRLAATLHRHGLALEAGQRVITGAYTRLRIEPGQHWTAEFSGIGKVEATIR